MTNVATLRSMWHMTSQRQLAVYVGYTQPAVVAWEAAHDNPKHVDPPYIVAKKFGVRYEWLVGDSATMWNDSVVAIQRDARIYLATISAKSPSQRFANAVSWLFVNHGDLVTETYLAGWLGVEVETLRDYTMGVDAGEPAKKRLAEFLAIDYDWFVTGELDTGDYSAVIEQARLYGITAKQLAQIVEQNALAMGRII